MNDSNKTDSSNSNVEAANPVDVFVRHFEPLKALGELIRTQDNRITDAPIFIVQRECREWGYDSAYCDDFAWINCSSGECEEADDEKHDELEGIDAACEDTGEWERCYYKDRWEFVTACFTEQGCKDYISANGHNLGKTRIYADGSYRNDEYRTVRQALIDA